MRTRQWLGLAAAAGLWGCSNGGTPGFAARAAPGAMMAFGKAQAVPGFMPAAAEKPNTAAFAKIDENDFRRVADEPLSTFSTDVDTASYSIVRSMLVAGRRPPADAVRIEELVNYFPYAYAPPLGDEPIAVHAETAACPWAPEHRLLLVGLKARDVQFLERKPNNLVFLLDVSGSMSPADRLPLVLQSMKLLVDQLREEDKVSIVVYAGAAGLALPTTSGADKSKICDALAELHAGGSTNGGAGVQLAYKTARDAFVPGGVNRVILCTDGDFNVGVGQTGLVDLVTEEAKNGVWLSVFGVGNDNLKDDFMEKLADRGNGNYAFLDTIAEGRKALVEQAGGTLVAVAKDAKFQVEFNPAQVAAYRLLGYENRALAAQDFNDDKKDAGDVGAGHTVTALYELVPAGRAADVPSVDPLKYQDVRPLIAQATSGELCTVKVRYKDPEASRSRLIETPVTDARAAASQASPDFKFAAAVASFGMLLRHSKHAGASSFDSTLALARDGLGADVGGYRHEFLDLVGRARSLPSD